MLRRLIAPLTLGLVGVAILLALGIWQVQRLGWKEGILAEIEARIAEAPVALPGAPDPVADRYLPVIVSGALGGQEAPVLVSLKDAGPGFRIISALTSGDRRVMVDLGFVPEAGKDASRMAPEVTITGNLHWPDEVDRWTPAPDAARGIWFARDVAVLAEALGTEPVLIVAREIAGADLGVRTLPVSTDGIPNNHLNYAITWFLLALAWAGMAVFMGARILRKE
ncbi:MAG: SURF1 family protein [Rubellimicrobium sp.]|nr:SURF1 family protein [Rubellimicrobium sp.]